MTSRSQSICAAAVCPAPSLGAPDRGQVIRDHNATPGSARSNWSRARLRKHADYQRVYKASRKHFSSSMSYFFRLRDADELAPLYAGPRVGLTAGRVLGRAVERNRIKRRMREAARANLGLLPQFADVVLHPRRAVLEMEFAKLNREVAKIFVTVSTQTGKTQLGENEAGA
jgi:ribonuclease P protein component